MDGVQDPELLASFLCLQCLQHMYVSVISPVCLSCSMISLKDLLGLCPIVAYGTALPSCPAAAWSTTHLPLTACVLLSCCPHTAAGQQLLMSSADASFAMRLWQMP